MSNLMSSLLIFCGALLGVLCSESSLANEQVVPAFTAPAKVYSKKAIEISSEVTGKVTKVVLVGQKVNRGDYLLRVDDKLEQKNRQSFLAKQSTLKEKNTILNVQFTRLKKLVEIDYLSQEHIEAKQLELMSLREELHDLNISLAKIEFVISRKNIKAEFDGVVIKQEIKEGETISISQSVLTILADDTQYAIANIPVSKFKHLNMSKAIFELESGEQLPLELDYIGSEVNLGSNTVEVSFALPGSSEVLMGQNGRMLFEKKI